MYGILEVLNSCIFVHFACSVGCYSCREQGLVDGHIFCFYQGYVYTLTSCGEELRNILVTVQTEGGCTFDVVGYDILDGRLVIYEITVG